MQFSTSFRVATAALVLATLGACATNQYGQPVPTANVRNAAVGAAAGAVAARAFDGNVGTGAAAGAALGALACDARMAPC